MHDQPHFINWEKIDQLIPEIPSQLYPRVTVVIPTFNDAKKIGLTLESLLAQDYPDLEILVIDAASRDRTIEIVKSYRDERIRLSSVSDYNRYEMLNKGIFLAKGLYLNFLFPGDYYISHDALKIMMNLVLQKHKAKLVYCGCLIRAAQAEVKVLFRHLDLSLLKKGQQPTSLQSCWFHRTVFHEIGMFNTHYLLRGGFDLMCRFLLQGHLVHADTRRVLTDYDLREVTARKVMLHAFETFRILLKNFGFATAWRWLIRQKELSRYLRFWRTSLKKALLGN